MLSLLSRLAGEAATDSSVQAEEWAPPEARTCPGEGSGEPCPLGHPHGGIQHWYQARTTPAGEGADRGSRFLPRSAPPSLLEPHPPKPQSAPPLPKKKSLGWGTGRPARFPSSPGVRCCCCWRRGRMGRPHPRTQQEPCCKRPWGDLQGQGGQGRSPDTPPGRAGAALRLLQTLPLRLATRLGKRKRPASRQSPPLRF